MRLQSDASSDALSRRRPLQHLSERVPGLEWNYRGVRAMLAARVARGQRFGMNSPGNDNRQLALNIIHWLSGSL